MFQYEFLRAIDILGTFSFAVSGAFFAMEKKLDPFGVIIIAFATAIGGGTLRDILIGNLPVGWLTNGTATLTIFLAAVGSMFFEARLRQLTTTLFLFDALGLGLFTIVGVQKAIAQNFSVGICIAIGTITASFGGVIRDVLLNHVPLVFRKEIYALASIIGGSVYFLLRHLQLDNNLTKIICILLIFAIRLIAVKYRLGLPAFYLSKEKKV
jgi:uncharacterized membrane protein YeiH